MGQEAAPWLLNFIHEVVVSYKNAAIIGSTRGPEAAEIESFCVLAGTNGQLKDMKT